ncbi:MULTISPECIES: DUF2970 domain-containing protein [Spongiibacter]|jgi:hypothetical protein|uniref:DUF2970 domain-containing protein n=1 Tax=Spongiibacter TaxID=630749 RepID=UPI000C092D0D|nr:MULTISPECIES: DUF2970 domain-containing protein [Spongiibacter]MAK45608.1 hypothetical protein [Spongiibacter sp.]MBM7423380.1 hypothetical protein [Spongiibacter marinus]MEE2653970.1 DUF2970 domain-containing protein [Pseudomonadota bacterium]|tara:strand:- start:2273 stop:2521 length:249 start_codon:yes stop_codon:yes gene_type:complete
MDNAQEKTEPAENNQKPLSFFEVFKQAISLMFALQNRSGQKRLMDLAETNPMPLIFAGVTAMAIFFLFCFISSQIVISLLTS